MFPLTNGIEEPLKPVPLTYSTRPGIATSCHVTVEAMAKSNLISGE